MNLPASSAAGRIARSRNSADLKIYPDIGARMSIVEHDTNEADRGAIFAACEEKIQYAFVDRRHLAEALTHASIADHRLASNERLEFLGDAILGAVVCEELYREYPQLLEGDLTRIKSAVVSRQTCAKISKSLGLSEFLLLGKGMTTGAALPSSLLSDVYEAIVAAIFLDGGMEAAKTFVIRTMGDEIEHVASADNCVNFKSQLQQFAQRDLGGAPTYELLDEKGPDHSKCFKVAAKIQSRRFIGAWGRNKKEAEQRAACNALCELRGEEPPFAGDQ